MNAWAYDDNAIMLLKSLIPRKGELVRPPVPPEMAAAAAAAAAVRSGAGTGPLGGLVVPPPSLGDLVRPPHPPSAAAVAAAVAAASAASGGPAVIGGGVVPSSIASPGPLHHNPLGSGGPAVNVEVSRALSQSPLMIKCKLLMFRIGYPL